MGFEDCGKQRKYYFSLSQSERDILLRGCKVDGGGIGYSVNGTTLCRKGFKKLFSVGYLH
jgi:hypothetical protein